MKTCSFVLPGGLLCGNPALKADPSGLCRLHVHTPKQSANVARARAEQQLLPGRRRAKSEAALRKRHLRDLQSVPVLRTFEACHAMLNNIVRSYEARVFDAATAQVMLRCLRIASTTIRIHGAAGDLPHAGAEARAQSKAFNLCLREALDAVRIDRKLERLHKVNAHNSVKLQRMARS